MEDEKIDESSSISKNMISENNPKLFFLYIKSLSYETKGFK